MTYWNSNPKPDPTPKKPKRGLDKRRKPSGEGAMFLEIWNERPHFSEISGDPLGEEPCAWMFLHILNKKKYPRYKLEKKNVALGTFDEHYILDFGTMEQIENHPHRDGFFKLLEKREELKIEYETFKPTV